MAGDPLASLEAWLQPLLTRLEPAERRALARTLATGLRRRQAARIAAQRNVDGSPYAPRAKPRPVRDRAAAPGPQAKVRHRLGAMFAKLRTMRHVKATASPASAIVEITGRTARIASIHQYGLFDRPQPGGPQVRYPVRELLGLSSDDHIWLQEQVLTCLTY
jgi:phage virion morphogenesis protein